MSGSVRQLNSIYRQSVMSYEEMRALKEVVRKGLEEVVSSNQKLDPTFVDPSMQVGAWRRVEEPKEEDYRPLVQSSADRVVAAKEQYNILKKLDVL